MNAKPETRAQRALRDREDFHRSLMGDPSGITPMETTEETRNAVLRRLQADHNREFRNFARRLGDGEAGPEDLLRFMALPWRVGRENCMAIATYAGEGPLQPDELDEFLRALDSTILTLENRGHDAGVSGFHMEELTRAVADQAVECALEANGLREPPPLRNHDPATATGFRLIQEMRVQQARSEVEKRGVSQLVAVVNETARETGEADGEGKFPRWFKRARRRVSPELAERGYNPAHPEPLDLGDSPENLGRSLGRLVREYRALAGSLELPDHPADIARLLLRPYLDRELARDLPLHDPDNFYYVDDGPINFEESDNRRALHGEIDDPRAHMALSYCRLVREAMMNRGVADDIYMNRPDLLGMSLPRNVMALQRLARFMGESGPAGERAGGYEPAVRWDLGTKAAWQRLGELTRGMTDNGPLEEAIESMGEHIAGTFTLDDYHDGESAVSRYDFVPQPRVSPDTDVDHPARALLREAAMDISRAGAVMRQVRELNERAGENAARNLERAQRNIEGREREGASPGMGGEDAGIRGAGDAGNGGDAGGKGGLPGGEQPGRAGTTGNGDRLLRPVGTDRRPSPPAGAVRPGAAAAGPRGLLPAAGSPARGHTPRHIGAVIYQNLSTSEQ